MEILILALIVGAIFFWLKPLSQTSEMLTKANPYDDYSHHDNLDEDNPSDPDID